MKFKLFTTDGFTIEASGNEIKPSSDGNFLLVIDSNGLVNVAIPRERLAFSVLSSAGLTGIKLPTITPGKQLDLSQHKPISG